MFVALLSLGMGFVIHVISTNQLISEFQNGTFHELAHITFRSKIDNVRENFRGADIKLLETDRDFQYFEKSGHFTKRFGWTIDRGFPLEPNELSKLSRPIIEGLSESSPWISWSAEIITEGTQKSGQPAGETDGVIEFSVKYTLID